MGNVADAKWRLAEAQRMAKQAAKDLKAARSEEAKEKLRLEKERKKIDEDNAKIEAEETAMLHKAFIGKTIVNVKPDRDDRQDSITFHFSDGTEFTIMANGGDEMGGWLTYGD